MAHKLPNQLLSIIASGKLKRDVGSWNLKEEKDSFGNVLETELGELLHTQSQIEEATSKLSEDFVQDHVYGNESFQGYPGEISDITDFTKIVCFAYSGDGSPFCLDYRESNETPSVIWWDNIYWRKVSPSIKEFLSLIDGGS